MPEDERKQPPSPDQNDPTGHARPGSPDYHEGRAPSNNQRPRPDVDAPPESEDEIAEAHRARLKAGFEARGSLSG